MGEWGYPNTDGFGIMEHFQWAEDIGAVSIEDSLLLK
jgi:alpha-L-arabinofuranosidase